jgi:outer membrane immunogenic protein
VSALAADLPVKAPPVVVASVYDWSGFYIGLDGGGGWARKCWSIYNNLGTSVFPAFGEGCSTASGGMAGGQVGYRSQSGAWVFGLEAKGDWANLRGSNPSLFYGPTVTNQTKVDGIGLFTGQIGYAWNNFLLYGKGGVAVAADKFNGITTATGLAFDTASETRLGPYAAIGGEYGITPNVSVGFEYGHGFMGTRTLFLHSIAAPTVISRADNISQGLDLFTARLNFRFGGPVVAKY